MRETETIVRIVVTDDMGWIKDDYYLRIKK